MQEETREALNKLNQNVDSLLDDMNTTYQEISQVEKSLLDEKISLESLQTIKAELGIRNGTWPDLGPQAGCSWCKAGSGR